MYVEYSSNNSGGRWWVEDEGWKALEAAGWKVKWFKDETNGRWLGALASYATKENCNSLKVAVEDWERATGCNSTDAGCPCCGKPHSFTLYGDDGSYVESGPESDYSCSWVED